ncbi:MAG TPA: recombinase family protein [Gemmatimonadaceae bacterium]|nr:recombinase family protein [Gemmatimonadaceae bacterium]
MRTPPRAAPEPALSRAIRPGYGGGPHPPRRSGVLDRSPDRTRTAIYLRVSQGGQSTENQRPDVLRIVEARGLELVDEYVETASAGGNTPRPAFMRMMYEARRGGFSVLVVWALDRFGRSMTKNLAAVLELDRIGIQIVSVREPWLDTGGPVRELLIAIFSWVAEQERSRLVERTKAGLDRARARGVRLGRPERRLDTRAARKLQREGLSMRAIAKRLKVPTTTLHRALAQKEKSK